MRNLKCSQVAQELGRSVALIQAYARKGVIPFDTTPGGHRRYDLDEVRQALKDYRPPGPSYHDIYITTAEIPRTSIFDLPYGLSLQCTRVAGWELWDLSSTEPTLVAGEYHTDGLRVQFRKTVIVDSLSETQKEAE